MTAVTPEQVPPPPSSDDDVEPKPPVEAPPGNPDDALGDAGKQALDRMKAEREEAKRNLKAAQRELDRFRQQSMTEAEKAVAEAEQRGRATAASEFGKRLATSEIRAAAATAGADLSGVFDWLDLSRFITEDGEPDDKAIASFVKGLKKKDADTSAPAPSFDGGTRTPAKNNDMNSIIRRQAGVSRSV